MILSGKLTTLSMGAICSHVQCSYCGKIIGDDEQNCEHLDNYIGKYLEDKQTGKKYIVSELCGAFRNGLYIPDSCHFIEASWVSHPAFSGAVVNYFVETDEMRLGRESNFKKDNILSFVTEDIFSRGLRVADVNGRMALKLAREELMLHRVAESILKSNRS